jgi:hypothetical protein
MAASDVLREVKFYPQPFLFGLAMTSIGVAGLFFPDKLVQIKRRADGSESSLQFFGFPASTVVKAQIWGTRLGGLLGFIVGLFILSSSVSF